MPKRSGGTGVGHHLLISSLGSHLGVDRPNAGTVRHRALPSTRTLHFDRGSESQVHVRQPRWDARREVLKIGLRRGFKQHSTVEECTISGASALMAGRPAGRLVWSRNVTGVRCPICPNVAAHGDWAKPGIEFCLAR